MKEGKKKKKNDRELIYIYIYIYILLTKILAQSAGAEEHTDYIFAERKDVTLPAVGPHTLYILFLEPFHFLAGR